MHVLRVYMFVAILVLELFEYLITHIFCEMIGICSVLTVATCYDVNNALTLHFGVFLLSYFYIVFARQQNWLYSAILFCPISNLQSAEFYIGCD